MVTDSKISTDGLKACKAFFSQNEKYALVVNEDGSVMVLETAEKLALVRRIELQGFSTEIIGAVCN